MLEFAIGNRKWWWAGFIVFTGPFVAIPYSFLNKEADYPRKLFLIGLSGLASGGLIYLLVLLIVNPL